MSLGRGLLFSALGALAGAIVWVILIQLTGLGLWLLAPVVGGAAGYGMMQATSMKGGALAGVAAGAITLLAIFGARYFVVSSAVAEHLTAGADDAVERLAGEVAAELEERDVYPYTEDGEYSSRVYNAAHVRWDGMPHEEQQEYLAAMNEEAGAAVGILMPLAMLFDFGILGTLCAAASIGVAYKAGGKTLEQALAEKGQASSDYEASIAASPMRARESDARTGVARPVISRWTMPLPPPEDSDIPPLQTQGEEAMYARPKKPAPMAYEEGEREAA